VNTKPVQRRVGYIGLSLILKGGQEETIRMNRMLLVLTVSALVGLSCAATKPPEVTWPAKRLPPPASPVTAPSLVLGSEFVFHETDLKR
jgi:hypothetical protein